MMQCRVTTGWVSEDSRISPKGKSLMRLVKEGEQSLWEQIETIWICGRCDWVHYLKCIFLCYAKQRLFGVQSLHPHIFVQMCSPPLAKGLHKLKLNLVNSKRCSRLSVNLFGLWSKVIWSVINYRKMFILRHGSRMLMIVAYSSAQTI